MLHTSPHSQLLEQSSASLRSTTAAHDTLSTLLSTSKHLIIALEKSDWLDRLLIFAAVAFFFLVVLLILKQRVVDKGIRIAFWWTRFLPDFSSDVKQFKANLADASTIAATVTTFTTASFATTTGLLSTSPEPALSTIIPPAQSLSIPDVEGVHDAIEEIVMSTTTQASLPLIPESSTIPQDSEPSVHQEL